MNHRQKKKKAKRLGYYIPNSELWNLDATLANYILPRLKKFKEINIAFPGRPPMDTPEKWDEAIDEMILSFELILQDPIADKEWKTSDELVKIMDEHNNVIQKGLNLFATYYQDLWI